MVTGTLTCSSIRPRSSSRTEMKPPSKVPTHRLGGFRGADRTDRLVFDFGSQSSINIKAMFNVAGMQVHRNTNAFSSPFVISSFSVEVWPSGPMHWGKTSLPPAEHVASLTSTETDFPIASKESKEDCSVFEHGEPQRGLLHGKSMMDLAGPFFDAALGPPVPAL